MGDFVIRNVKKAILLLVAVCARKNIKSSRNCIILDRRQSKTLLTIDKRGSKIGRSSVFECRLSPVGRKMAIKNTVSYDFLIYVRRW